MMRSSAVRHVFGAAGLKMVSGLLLLVLLMGFGSAELAAQPTQFTYQGSLNDEGSPADGNYDFEFALFDQSAAGAQVGMTLARSNVAVADGIFTVELDFGSQFPGADRFLEIRVRAAGGGGFTTLAPRQQITSAPYAVNARNLGGVAANQYVLTGDARLSDARSPLPGSTHYIQNIQNGTGPQGSSNFYISGTGKANVFDATESFHVGGERVLTASSLGTTIAGYDAGLANPLGSTAGLETGANLDVPLGTPPAGSDNSFFGFKAGRSNVEGYGNSFYGSQSGEANVEGASNAFFGAQSGISSNGHANTFIGERSGFDTTTGGGNTFLGLLAGHTNTTGMRNTAIGLLADVGSANLTNATAIGSYSEVTSSNSIVLGSIAGVNGAIANTNVGIGTTAPQDPLHIGANGSHMLFGGFNCSAGFVGIVFGTPNGSCQNYSLLGDGTDTMVNAPSGGTILFRIGNLTRATINASGVLGLPVLGAAGSTSLCRNASNQVSTCSSSLRYKSNIANFSPGLDLIKRLRPVSFMWKDGGSPDLGLVAEEVAGIEPLLTTLNPDGRTEGVKYDRLGVVLVNAVKEQQQLIELKQIEIDRQHDLIRRQQAEIDLLQARQTEFEAEIRALVCPKNDAVQAGESCNS